MEQTQSQIDESLPILPILPILPPPPIALFNLIPPQISDGSYVLYYQKKHIAMIHGEEEFTSSKQQVEAKCVKQLQQSEKNSTQSQSTGQKVLRNLQICSKCEKCGYWIENVQMKSHRSFHAAVITENILLGDKVASMSKKELFERNKVTHIVNAAFQLKNYFEEQGTKYIHLQLYDDMAEELIPEVLKAAHFIDDAIKSGGTVFVHCAMGKSRSVSAIIMYLMHHQRMSYEESLQLIRASRPIAKPNLSYERQLKEYYEGLLKSK